MQVPSVLNSRPPQCCEARPRLVPGVGTLQVRERRGTAGCSVGGGRCERWDWRPRSRCLLQPPHSYPEWGKSTQLETDSQKNVYAPSPRGVSAHTSVKTQGPKQSIPSPQHAHTHVTWCQCGEKGKGIFTEKEPVHIPFPIPRKTKLKIKLGDKKAPWVRGLDCLLPLGTSPPRSILPNRDLAMQRSSTINPSG